MKSVMLLTSFFFLSYFPLKAQIVFTAADLPQIGDKVITASAAVADTLNPGPAGANQTWDFSFLIASDTISLDVVDASTTPFADSFPNAGLALQSGDFFTYAQLTSDALFSLGRSIDPSTVMNVSPITRTSPPDKIYELPTTSTTAYIDQYGTAMGFAGTPPLDSILTTSETTDTVMVDGYGTLITPEGTYQALRLHTRTSTTTTTATMISGVWLPATSNTVLTESYSWIAKETKGDALTIFYNANGQALSASWSLNQNTGVAPAAVFVFEDRGEGEVAFSDFSLNNPASWSWDFGDGNTSSEQNPTHTFAAAGIYNVCLTVGNEFGSNTTCQMISIQLSVAPLAAFTFENKGEGEFAFTDVSANGPLSWSWDFGDGNTSSEQNPTHTFAASGTYNVCLTVANAAGSNTICLMVDAAVSVAPVAAFSIEDQGEGQFAFTDVSTNTPTSWSWDFGDGNTSSEQNPTHTFAASGTYNICLTVGNVAGDNTICQMIAAVVSVAPVAAFSVEDQGEGQFTFTDASTNTPTSWSWDFGDGNTSSEQNPTHTFAASGTYNVCLTVGNVAGDHTICQMIAAVVSVAPVAAFSVEDQGGGQFTFSDASTNTPTSWSWDFGDGNTSSEQNPTHTFTTSGTYNVCLTAGNVAGDNTICEMVNASITSTQALQRQYGFRLYPNPTSTGFQIEIRQLAQEALLIRFYNQIGQEIFSASLKGDQYIDAHAWPKGVYNYSVLSKNGGLMGSGRVLVE